MDFNESKPEFQQIDSEFEIKEELVWEDVKEEPGCSLCNSWNEVGDEEKPSIFEVEIGEGCSVKEELEWNEIGECSQSYQPGWDGKQEDLELEDVNEVGDKEKPPILKAEFAKESNVSYLSESFEIKEEQEREEVEKYSGGDEEKPPILEAETAVETRKRLAGPHILQPPASKKIQYMVPKMKPMVSFSTSQSPRSSILDFPVIDQMITSAFRVAKHPSLNLMIDLSEKGPLTFRDVFEKFAKLRRLTRTRCTRNDICDRTRKRFEMDSLFSTDPLPNPNARLVCANIFKKLDLTKDIEQKYIHIILETSPPEWPFTPKCIRHEWNLYRRNNSDSLLRSYFAKNAHPTVQQMIDISKKSGKPYELVFRRFKELRYAKRVTCVENDTCQIIQKLSGLVPKLQKVDEETKQVVMDDFEELRRTRMPSSVDLPCRVEHLIMTRYNLTPSTIQKIYSEWRQNLQRMECLQQTAQFLKINAIRSHMENITPRILKTKAVHPGT